MVASSKGDRDLIACSVSPTISVILPVYNAASYLQDSIDSILCQTYGDFELIIINDGSRDASGEIIRSYSDSRIVYLEQSNRGLAATLNRGIEFSSGRYVARQDADDIAMPERFARQISFLESHKEYALVGTWAEIWSDRQPSGRVHRHPRENPRIQFHLLFDNPFVHSSVVVRGDILKSEGGYTADASRQPPEDYELWSRLARKYPVANLPEILQIYREVPGSICRDAHQSFVGPLITISSENIAWRIGLPTANSLSTTMAALVHGDHGRVDPGIPFGTIRDALTTASEEIAASTGTPRAELQKMEEQYLSAIHFQFLSYRYPPIIATLLHRLWLTAGCYRASFTALLA